MNGRRYVKVRISQLTNYLLQPFFYTTAKVSMNLSQTKVDKILSVKISYQTKKQLLELKLD